MNSYLMTDKGLARNNNQDDVLAVVKENGDALYVLCDGMGGHSGGAIACKKCINVFKKEFNKSKYTNSEEAKLWLYKMILKANKEIISVGYKDSSLRGMGTTFVVAVILPDIMYVANIGDSRLYVIGDEIKQITLDHSLVEELIRTGQLDRKKVRFHPDRNVITRALGTGNTAVPDFFEVTLKKNEKVLLCSDGLTNMVEDDEIRDIVMQKQFVDKTCEQLVKRANYYGGKDNIGVVVVAQTLNEV